MDQPPRSPAPIDTLTQQRLASVLSATYSDSDIRDALTILDARFVENTPESRRQLRADVQADVIASHARIARDFASVSKRLTRIGDALQSINEVVFSLRARSNAAVAETGPVLDESTELLKHRREISQKQTLLATFTHHFTVSEDDREILMSPAEPVDNRFFAILRNVKRIHEECHILLSSGSERAGTDIMDEMATLLNSAFQKLYRWVQRELKSLSLENPQVNAGIRRALRVLAERPTLFQNCLDFFAEARQKIIIDSFYVAMTGIASDSDLNLQLDRNAKPIELYAHDPLRYVGDILAWLHSTAVSEQEALEVLFVATEQEPHSSIANRIQEGLKNELGIHSQYEDQQDDELDISSSLLGLVNKDLEPVSKPLRARVEQAIASQESCTLSYRLSSLVNFYRQTFEKLLGNDSVLVTTIQNLEAAALRQFNTTLDDHVRSVRNHLPHPTEELSPPVFLLDALSELTVLLKTFTSTLGVDQNVEVDANDIFKRALDPYLECCSDVGRNLTQKSRHIFLLNCLYAVQQHLQSNNAASSRLQDLAESIRSHVYSLVDIEHETFLDQSGIRSLIAVLGDHQPPYSPSILTNSVFQKSSLQAIAQKLDTFLSSALLDARKDLMRLNARGTIDEIVQHAVSRFIADFERLDGALSAALGDEQDSNGEAFRQVWPRTSAEVKVLLS